MIQIKLKDQKAQKIQHLINIKMFMFQIKLKVVMSLLE